MYRDYPFIPLQPPQSAPRPLSLPWRGCLTPHPTSTRPWHTSTWHRPQESTNRPWCHWALRMIAHIMNHHDSMAWKSCWRLVIIWCYHQASTSMKTFTVGSIIYYICNYRHTYVYCIILRYILYIISCKYHVNSMYVSCKYHVNVM